MTYQALVRDLEDWREDHRPHDVVTKLPHYEFSTHNGGILSPLAQTPALRDFALNEHSLHQMLGRLDFPVRFYNRLPAGLQFQNVNWLVQNGAYEKDVLLRVQDENRVRALLSGRFESFDHLELLRLLGDFVGDATVRWQHLDDEVLHLSLSYPNTATEVKVGDVVETGVHISNSEVGMRSVTVCAYVYRLKCSNGVIGRDSGSQYRFRHTGDGDKLRQAVQAAMSDVWMNAQGIVAKYKQALQEMVDRPIDAIESVSKDRGLTQDEFKRVLESFNEEPGRTRFELSQAFSRAAQVMESAERSFELQRVAYDVLN